MFKFENIRVITFNKDNQCLTLCRRIWRVKASKFVQTETKGKIIESKLAEHYTDFTDVHKYPETSQMLAEIQDQLGKIHALGYRQMPEEMYLDWLVGLKTEKEKYSNKNISTFNPTKKQ